jgi:hypothetical protein
MRHRDSCFLSFVLAIFLTPALVGAQQRAAGTPSGSVQVAAPSRAMPLRVSPTMAHVPVGAGAPPAAVHGGGMGSTVGAHPSTPRIAHRPVASKTPAQTYSRPANPSHVRRSGTFFNPTPDDGNGVPGLGFDYPHYAATHPTARHSHFYGGSTFPFVGGGIYAPTMGYVDAGVPTDAAAEQQPGEPQESGVEASEPPRTERAPIVAEARPRYDAAPAPSAEYTFVRRDGTVFFAVAYSWVNGNLQYVTSDGFRKLVSTITLDLDATTRFNEQRGVAFRSPA